jgi:hypothetical protein
MRRRRFRFRTPCAEGGTGPPESGPCPPLADPSPDDAYSFRFKYLIQDLTPQAFPAVRLWCTVAEQQGFRLGCLLRIGYGLLHISNHVGNAVEKARG